MDMVNLINKINELLEAEYDTVKILTLSHKPVGKIN